MRPVPSHHAVRLVRVHLLRWRPAVHVLLACCLLPSGASAATTLAEFEMEFVGERVVEIVVPVSIAGAEYRFEINTDMLQTSFDEQLRHLITGRPLRTIFFSSGRLQVSKSYRAPPCAIGPIPLDSLNRISCRPISQPQCARGGRIDGSLGIDALRNCVLQLDFDRGKVRFLDEPPPDAGTRVMLEPAEDTPAIRCAIGGDPPRIFSLDTAFCGEGMLALDDYHALIARGDLLPAITPAETTGNRALPPHLAILRVPLNTPAGIHVPMVFVQSPFNYAVLYNTLGLDFLSRYTVTFDFAHWAVYLKPGATYAALRPFVNMNGARLGRVGAQIVVVSVQGGSRAAGAAHTGDVLKTIDGKEAALMPDAEIVRWLTDRRREVLLEFQTPTEGRTWSLRIPPYQYASTAANNRQAQTSVPAKRQPMSHLRTRLSEIRAAITH